MRHTISALFVMGAWACRSDDDTVGLVAAAVVDFDPVLPTAAVGTLPGGR